MDHQTPPSPQSEQIAPQTRALLDAALDPMIIIDAAGGVVEWNRRAEGVLGRSRREAVGKALHELVLPEDFHDRFLRGIQAAAGSDRPGGEWMELTALAKDGSEFPAELSIGPLQFDDGPLFCVHLRDLTEQKQAEERLARRTLEARLIQQAATLSAAAVSYEDSLRGCLESLCEITEWPVGHVYLPDEHDRYLVPSDIWHFDDPKAFETLRYVTRRTRFRRGEGLPGRIWESGEPAWIADVADDANYPRNQGGASLGVRGTFGVPVKIGANIVAVMEFFTRDVAEPDQHLLNLVHSVSNQMGRILERKRWGEERSRLASIVDSSYDAIIGKDLDGTILTWNAGATHVFGYAAEEAIGQPISIIIPEDFAGEEPEIREVLSTGRRLEQFETVRRHKDGRRIDVSITASPLLNHRGEIVGSSMIERDISSRKRAEAELKQAKEAAEAANRAKSEFLANVSHELRTPMNAIIGMTDLALEEPLSPALRDHLETVKESADTLLYLLNDILDFARMEAGRFELEEVPFELRETLDQAVKTLSLRAHEKGLELACHIHSDVPEQLVGDARRLKQVIMNLAGNAIKFTEQGEVVVEVSLESAEDGEVGLRFEVADTGIGISEEDQERVFAPFTQADASTTRRFMGTGLGLTISKELVELMGGRIWLESELGRGSRFRFTSRFRRAARRRTPDRATVRELRGLPVLVVDDNETNRRILQEMLENWSMQPVMVADGSAALEEMRRAAASGRPYPLVLVDALMPEMDGFTLIERIRGDEQLCGATVLMLSSADRQVFAEKCRDLEVAVFLEKPVSQSDVLDAIMTALRGPQLDRPTVERLDHARRPLRVLLVEDTPANQKVVQAILQKRGHGVVVANNGREAVNALGEGNYDLVLMDVQMPTMDGFQATAMIRRLPEPPKANVPIVAMTAHAMQGDQERCLAAGMNAYIAKPIDAKKLIRLVEGLARPRGQQAATAAPGPQTDAPAEEGQDGVNLQAAEERLGDPQLLREMIGFFLQDSPELLTRIRQAVGESDADQVQRAAHSLKGLIANFGNGAAHRAALRVEKLGQAAHFDRLADAVEELETEVAKLRQSLSQPT